MKNRYVVVSRNKDEETKVRVVDNFYVAWAIQLAMLTGSNADIFLSPEVFCLKGKDRSETFLNLVNKGRDRLANDEEEVYIFVVNGRKEFRGF